MFVKFKFEQKRLLAKKNVLTVRYLNIPSVSDIKILMREIAVIRQMKVDFLGDIDNLYVSDICQIANQDCQTKTITHRSKYEIYFGKRKKRCAILVKKAEN